MFFHWSFQASCYRKFAWSTLHFIVQSGQYDSTTNRIYSTCCTGSDHAIICKKNTIFSWLYSAVTRGNPAVFVQDFITSVKEDNPAWGQVPSSKPAAYWGRIQPLNGMLALWRRIFFNGRIFKKLNVRFMYQHSQLKNKIFVLIQGWEYLMQGHFIYFKSLKKQKNIFIC